MKYDVSLMWNILCGRAGRKVPPPPPNLLHALFFKSKNSFQLRMNGFICWCRETCVFSELPRVNLGFNSVFIKPHLGLSLGAKRWQKSMVWKAQQGTKRSKKTKQKERHIQSILFSCHGVDGKNNFFILLPARILDLTVTLLFFCKTKSKLV